MHGFYDLALLYYEKKHQYHIPTSPKLVIAENKSFIIADAPSLALRTTNDTVKHDGSFSVQKNKSGADKQRLL